eukprot:CAMPEP_0167752562 /NCGR_PEP_ID=MMETSP0110_2-20121227/7211_1 /TAXON_ID=629695 /ORGANISM="Gymnochlora sp., Strain CCMP2014" /LENGTH=161 /DNA_ID=CAMNT_0007638199 /DNA_START=99 /DNA_END=584 /DNA_ORIENTATION=+
MGVSGSGKSTVGLELAKAWKADFKDADDFHSQGNKTKMSNGIPLTDGDRLPWLKTLASLVASYALERKQRLVLACSALKKSYRNILRGKLDEGVTKIVFLDGSQELIAKRLSERKHFFNSSLLSSQFEALERPDESEKIMKISVENTSKEIVEDILKTLQL